MSVDVVMMVRNGGETLEAALASVHDQVDQIVAYIAGASSDNTEELLHTYGARIAKGVWTDNFAAARNRTFEYARHDCGTIWALLMDADDVLVCEDLKATVAELEEQHCAVGYAKISFGSLQYMQKRLFNLSEPGRWVGRVHEVYLSEGASRQCPEVEIVHIRGTGVSDPGRNLRIFDQWHEEASTEFDGHTFYNYANELMWARRYTDAARMYDLAAAMSVWDDEKYFALLRRGKCLVSMREWAPAWACYIEAVKIKPTWKDTYLEMARWFYYQELWELSIVLSLQADVKEPADTIMPISERNYTVGQIVFDSYALGKLKRYAEALSVTKAGLEVDPANKMLLQNLTVYQKTPYR